MTACVCCQGPYEDRARTGDPWDGRLNGYCWDCALMRCDAEGCCQRNDRAAAGEDQTKP
jgi:hypothetical protein